MTDHVPAIERAKAYWTGCGSKCWSLTDADYASLIEEHRTALDRIRVLEGALRLARPYVADLPIVGDADLAVIDAALTPATERQDV